MRKTLCFLFTLFDKNQHNNMFFLFLWNNRREHEWHSLSVQLFIFFSKHIKYNSLDPLRKVVVKFCKFIY